MNNSTVVANFIDEVWNHRNFENMDSFVHPAFVDHSLPEKLSPDMEGTKKWIIATGSSFEHQTIIEDQVTEGDKSVVKISMHLKHIGTWRDIEPTGFIVTTKGYRMFRLQDGKIIEHWALIDGQSIESQLKTNLQGCKIPQ